MSGSFVVCVALCVSVSASAQDADKKVVSVESVKLVPCGDKCDFPSYEKLPEKTKLSGFAKRVVVFDDAVKVVDFEAAKKAREVLLTVMKREIEQSELDLEWTDCDDCAQRKARLADQKTLYGEFAALRLFDGRKGWARAQKAVEVARAFAETLEREMPPGKAPQDDGGSEDW